MIDYFRMIKCEKLSFVFLNSHARFALFVLYTGEITRERRVIFLPKNQQFSQDRQKLNLRFLS